jgi:predicted exporter
MRPDRWALFVWLALLALGVVVASRTSYRTSMGDFLPHSTSLAQAVLAGQAENGAASHIVLVGITGADPAPLAALSDDLAARLRPQPAFIDVLNGAPQSFAGVQGFMWRNRYLLSPQTTPAAFTEAGLHQALAGDLGLLGSDMGPALEQSLPADPTGALWGLLRGLSTSQGPAVQNGVWMSADGRTALLLVHTTAPGFNLDAQQQAQAALAQAFAQARAAVPGAGAAVLHISGPGVFAVRTRDATKADVTRLSMLAMGGAVALLFFAYRSPRVLLLGLLPIVSGALAAIAAVSAWFGFVHGITLGFGVTLIGESLDYAIYLFTQRGQDETPGAAMTRLWPTLRLGALTSVAGFAAMLFSSFTGFAQLGLFSIAGLVAAVLVTRFVLPALMPRGFQAPGAVFLARPVAALVRHRRTARVLVGVAALAAGAALALHRGPFWDNNLLDLSPIPAADQALDTQLRSDMGVPDQRYFAVLRANTQEQALEGSEALASALDPLVASGQLASYDAPSAILPSARTQSARQAALPDPATLHARFAAASAGLPFRAQVFAPFFADAEAARTRKPLTVADLPPPLALELQSMLVPMQGGWVAMVPLHGVTNPAALAGALPPGAGFADLDAQSAQLLGTFESEAVALAVCGSLAVAALLLAGLRAPRRALRVAAPLLVAVLLTAALLTLGGGTLSIFKVAGFLLIIAIGSNYALFFEHPSATAIARARAAASIVLANLCTVAAYGLMSLSMIPVLHDIGETVALGTFFSLVCGAVLSARETA